MAAGVKLLVFSVVSLLVTGLLAAIMGNFGFGDQAEYKAVFSSASMLEKGDDVRVAGVTVGEVKKVEHYKRTMALVTFKVQSGVPAHDHLARRDPLPQPRRRPLPRARGGRPERRRAARRQPVRHHRGHRRRQLRPSDHRHPVAGRRHHPVGQTTPALDLTTLFNGFQPLFQALNPQADQRAEPEPHPGAAGRGRHRSSS
jgi:phospholipid/cholesterol/gamma-HCH transport system substrate-binding protein